jgi:hypothetical protein
MSKEFRVTQEGLDKLASAISMLPYREAVPLIQIIQAEIQPVEDDSTMVKELPTQKKVTAKSK